MREKQLIMIPTDSKYKAKNVLWSEAIEWSKVSNEELKKIVEDGIEVNGFYFDEALIYDNRLS
jgi:hypothetical protein